MKTKKEKLEKFNFETFIKEDPSEKDLISQFAIYVSSNPDFKYNSTYLIDAIEPFLKARIEFKRRYHCFKNITQILPKQELPEKQVTLVFDNIFKFSIKQSSESRVELINTDQYHFDKATEGTSYIIKFERADENMLVKSETYKLSQDPSKPEIDKELESFIKKIWNQFIK